MGKRWTKDEEQYLIDSYNIQPVKITAEHINRTLTSVKKKAFSLGITNNGRNDGITWTSEEEEYLIRNYKNQAVKETAKVLGRTASSIQRKANKLGLSDSNRVSYGKGWTEDEIEYLIEHYLNQPVLRTAIKLARTEISVAKKAQSLGLYRSAPSKKSRLWTEEEDNYLIKKYTKQPVKATAKKLNRTENSVRRRAEKLGLNKHLDILGAKAISRCFNCDIKVVKRWIEDLGLPAEKLKNGKYFKYNIDTTAFWKWAEENKSEINWAKYEEDSLPPEPDWVMKEVRSKSRYKYEKRKFSQHELLEIKFLLEQGVTKKEISRKLGRSYDSIKEVCKRLERGLVG